MTVLQPWRIVHSYLPLPHTPWLIAEYNRLMNNSIAMGISIYHRQIADLLQKKRRSIIPVRHSADKSKILSPSFAYRFSVRHCFFHYLFLRAHRNLVVRTTYYIFLIAIENIVDRRKSNKTRLTVEWRWIRFREENWFLSSPLVAPWGLKYILYST